jgi:hypothetical protein
MTPSHPSGRLLALRRRRATLTARATAEGIAHRRFAANLGRLSRMFVAAPLAEALAAHRTTGIANVVAGIPMPRAAALLDFTENALIALLTTRYPERMPIIAATSGLVTGMKTIAYVLTAALLATFSLLQRRPAWSRAE